MQRIKFAVGVVIVAPLFGQLQSRPEVLQLGLKQAVEMALAPEGSTRGKLAEEALKQAEARRLEARAALLPDLEGYVQDQNETNNLKAIGFHFPTSPIPGFSIPTFVGPFNVLDVRASCRGGREGGQRGNARSGDRPGSARLFDRFAR
jgi:hypothetical protein